MLQATCLNCGDEHISSHAVWIYTRPEDHEMVHTLGVELASTHGTDISTTIETNAESGNPSARRYGILVSFHCEQCGSGPLTELMISEHKGTTQIEWRLAERY